jgi:protein tyrosine phosphatase
LLFHAIDYAIEKTKRSGNLAVHCSAGVGRTGIFLTLFFLRLASLHPKHRLNKDNPVNSFLKDYFQAKKLKDLNPLDKQQLTAMVIMHLRVQRNSQMVQDQIQAEWLLREDVFNQSIQPDSRA